MFFFQYFPPSSQRFTAALRQASPAPTGDACRTVIAVTTTMTVATTAMRPGASSGLVTEQNLLVVTEGASLLN